MKTTLKTLASLLLLLLCIPAARAGEKAAFYDSKSWIVPVAGHFDLLRQMDLGGKVYGLDFDGPKDIVSQHLSGPQLARQLNEAGFGKLYLDYLTDGGRNETILKQIALANVQRADEELGSESIRAVGADGLQTLLSEDYLPVLTRLYFMTNYKTEAKNSKGELLKTEDGQQIYIDNWSLFRIKIDPEQAFDIMSCIADPTRWNALPDFPTEFITSGAGTLDKEKEVIKACPDLALRGVLLRRAPARISIGENAGLKKGDIVSLYSQQQDKEGNWYSKRISRARVHGVWEKEAQINFEANTAGNRKNGDIVVRTPMSNLRFGIEAEYTSHSWGGELLFDFKTGFSRIGIVHHFLFDLGMTLTDKPGNKYCILNDEHFGPLSSGEKVYYKYYAPLYANIGLGYGISKTFVGFVDLMGYFKIQPEFSWMACFDDVMEQTSSNDPTGLALRIPIGVRLSFNLGYPCRFFIGGGYAPCLGGNKYIKETQKLMGVKRDGLFLNAGFTF